MRIPKREEITRALLTGLLGVARFTGWLPGRARFLVELAISMTRIGYWDAMEIPAEQRGARKKAKAEKRARLTQARFNRKLQKLSLASKEASR